MTMLFIEMTEGGTTTISDASLDVHRVFKGTVNVYTVQFAAANTFSSDRFYRISNDGVGTALTVQNSTGSETKTIYPGDQLECSLTGRATAAGVWTFRPGITDLDFASAYSLLTTQATVSEPEPIALSASTLLGRKSTGGVAALTKSDVLEELGIQDIFDATSEPTGFETAGSGGTLSFTEGTRTFTITGSHNIFIAGVAYAKTTASVVIANTTGVHYVYYNASAALTEGTDFPGFDSCLVATVYWNVSTSKGLLADERHGVTMDGDTHRWMHTTVGTRYVTGLAGTFGNSTFSIAEGSIADEDLVKTITNQTTCYVLYKNGSADWVWDASSATYYKMNGSNLRYNNGNSLANVGSNHYMAMWIFGTTDISAPIVALMGQRTDTTLADARANNTYESLTLGTLPYKEMKVLFRVILRNTGSPPTYIEAQDLRSVSNIPAGAYVATSHGVLSGLANDDHTQYLLLAGRSGGQTAYGGTAASETLVLRSTSHSTKGKIYFGSNSVYDEANGRLGINQTSPAYNFDITGTGRITSTLLVSTSVSTPSVISPASSALTLTPAAGYSLNIATSGAGNFAVNTSQLSLVTSTGKFGIGIAAPAAGLNLVTAPETLGGLAALAAEICTTTVAIGPVAGIGFCSSVTGASLNHGAICGYRESSDAATTTGGLSFYSRPSGGSLTLRQHIMSGGDVGFGLIPKASGYGKSIALSMDSADDYTVICTQDNGTNDHRLDVGNNCYNSGLGAWKYYASSQSATRYRQCAGAHDWYSAPTGTADADITWLNTLNLDSSGNLTLLNNVYYKGLTSSGTALQLLGVKGTDVINFGDANAGYSLRYGNSHGYMYTVTNGCFGFNTVSPAARVDILGTTEQLRLSYSGSYYTALTTSSAGNFTIDPNGGTVAIDAVVKLYDAADPATATDGVHIYSYAYSGNSRFAINQEAAVTTSGGTVYGYLPVRINGNNLLLQLYNYPA